MTDRVYALTVVLDHDIRADDVEPLRQAILQMRNVLRVDGNVTDPGTLMAESRAQHEMHTKLFNAIYPKGRA